MRQTEEAGIEGRIKVYNLSGRRFKDIPLRLVHLLHGRWLLLTFCVCSPSLALFWQREWTRLDQLLRD